MTISVMLTAKDARSKARHDLAIFNEVRDIEFAILTASAAGEYQSIISTSRMTDTELGIVTAREYCKVWQGAANDRAKENQMAAVNQYFNDMGYSVERRINNSTGDTFSWYIYW